jgi:methyl-accepting chemotaxis protein
LYSAKKDELESYFDDHQKRIEQLTETISSLQSNSFQKLKADHKGKEKVLEEYFLSMKSDLESLVKASNVLDGFKRFKEYHDMIHANATSGYKTDSNKYKEIWEKTSYLREHAQGFGYSNIYMICAKHGHVMYATHKNEILGQNLGVGEYKNSALAAAWNCVVTNKETCFQPFKPFVAGSKKQIAYMGTPLFNESHKMVATLIIEILPKKINDMLHSRSGYGKSEETFLVGLIDGKQILQCDRVTEDAKIGSLKKGESIAKALKGGEGTGIKINSEGSPEILYYSKVKCDIKGFNYAVQTTYDLEEAIATKGKSESLDLLQKFTKEYGYYDLFLLNAKGLCFYSVCHEADYKTNLLSGPYKDSSFGEAVAQALQTGDFAFGDFKPYDASNGIPSAFIVKPVIEDGKVALLVALQM